MEASSKKTKKRASKLVLIVMCLLMVAGVVFYQFSGPTAPVYEGRRLSSWFEEYQRASEIRLAGGASSDPEQFAEAFRKLGHDAVPYLIQQLTNKSRFKEKYVSWKSASPGWAFKVMPTVQVGNWSIRRCSAELLGKIGPTASNAVPALIEAIAQTEIYQTDKSTGASNGQTYSPQARVEAIQALIKIAPGSRDVITALIEALKQKYVRVPVPFNLPPSTVADVAAATLTNLGSEFRDQIPVMIANLKYQDQRQFRGAGISAIYSALAPGYGEHVPRLMNALEDPATETRDAAAYDLGAIRPPDRGKAKAALPALEEALNDSQALIRIRVAETILAIDRTRTKEVVPALVNLMAETNYLVRLRAIDSLRLIGIDAKDAVPPLTKALKDDSRTVQTWAAEALKQVDPEAAANAGIK